MAEKFSTTETAWCPGCGNFGIIKIMTEILNESKYEPSDVVLVGGIGQAAKTNQYIEANGFSGLHGRALPAAVAIKLANENLCVIVNSGDGDSYGEGGNHFLHNIRRNVNITHLVHDNQIYGLTKGQTSPTSDACGIDHNGACNMNVPFNPLMIAISAGATFVARAYAGNREQFAEIIKAAIAHEGYSLVNILQPCVVFNKVNTYTYYKTHVYELDESYDPSNKLAALEKSMEGGDRLPIGIIYREEALTFEQKRPDLFDGTPIVKKPLDMNKFKDLLNTFI